MTLYLNNVAFSILWSLKSVTHPPGLKCYLSARSHIHPVDDVDVVFIIDETFWPGLFSFSDPPVAPVLASFERAVRSTHPTSRLRSQGHSLGLRLNDLTIDIVPAIEDDEDSDFIRIPNRESGKWLESSPKVHAKIVDDIDDMSGELFRPLVKILKAWNYGIPSTARLKSFAIETIACRLFESREFEDLEEGVLLFFDFMTSFRDDECLEEWGEEFGMSFGFSIRSVPDLAGTGGNILSGVDYKRVCKFIEQCRLSRDKLLKVNRARTKRRRTELCKSAIRR